MEGRVSYISASSESNSNGPEEQNEMWELDCYWVGSVNFNFLDSLHISF